MTLPFVVRAVQPVLLELDEEMEEAAASLGARSFAIFRRIILPDLTARRSLSGVALAFARAIGEFGAAGADLGEPCPFKTEVSSRSTSSSRSSPTTARALPPRLLVLLLLISLAVLLLINLLSRWSLRHGRKTGNTRRRLRLGRG